jgi:glycine hydroxymethyltransferase
VLCTQQWAQALDKSVFPGIQGGPLMHTIAAKAVAFGEALRPEFKRYQRQVVENARAMAEEFARAGLRLVAGGTDTHLMLVDVSVRGLTGKAVEAYLDAIGITVNKNAIPFDTQKPTVASGIRIGTPAITSRGMGVEESREIARIICDAFGDIETGAQTERLRKRVRELTSRFDVP